MNQFWENNECIWSVKVFVEVASIQQPSSNKIPTYNQCRDKCNTKHVKGKKKRWTMQWYLKCGQTPRTRPNTRNTMSAKNMMCVFNIGNVMNTQHTTNTKNTMNIWIENTNRQTLRTQQMPKRHRTLGTWWTSKTRQVNKLRTWWIDELRTWWVSRLWGTLRTWQANKIKNVMNIRHMTNK